MAFQEFCVDFALESSPVFEGMPGLTKQYVCNTIIGSHRMRHEHEPFDGLKCKRAARFC